MPRPWYPSSRSSHMLEEESEPQYFLELIKSLPRPYHDPKIELQIKLYEQYSLIEDIRTWFEMPVINEVILKGLGVVRGAIFDVDEEQPVDFEPRFFAIGSSSKAAEYINRFEKEGNKWPEVLPEVAPEVVPNSNRRFNDFLAPMPRYTEIGAFIQAYSRIIDGGINHESQGPFLGGKNPHWAQNYPPPTTRLGYLHHVGLITLDKDQQFKLEGAYTYGSKDNPTVSHNIALMRDTFEPGDEVRRSELFLATLLTMYNLERSMFRGKHYTFPLLLFSFHSGGGRILQIHPEHGKLYVRISRPLDFVSRDGKVPPDGRLLTRWLLARPIGDTTFPKIRDEDSTWMEEEEDRRNKDPGAASSLAVEPPASLPLVMSAARRGICEVE